MSDKGYIDDGTIKVVFQQHFYETFPEGIETIPEKDEVDDNRQTFISCDNEWFEVYHQNFDYEGYCEPEIVYYIHIDENDYKLHRPYDIGYILRKIRRIRGCKDRKSTHLMVKKEDGSIEFVEEE